MIRQWSVAATAALWWLGAGLAVADVVMTSDIDQFNALAEAHDGFPHQAFRSSDIAGPVFYVDSWDHNLTDNSGYIFIGSVYGRHRAGPMILDASDLSLVYADQKWENTYYSEPQVLNGTPYLTFWEGSHSRGHANGFCLIVDEQYNIKHNVSAVGLNGALADMHEMQVTTDGTVIFTTYFSIPYDCTPWGGPEDGLLMDSGFQEVDIETNELLFEWSASKHFSPNDTSARYNGDFGVSKDSGFDFAHINSVRKVFMWYCIQGSWADHTDSLQTEDGNYLVSSRHLHTIALIDGSDGHPIWILGGKNNQFEDLSDGKATGFSWQHNARFYNDHSHITMFDNHGEKTGSCDDDCRTRGLHIEIDTDAMTARLVAEYYHPRHINAGAMGGLQMLENGNVLTAWGYAPAYVEFTPDGTTVMDIQRGSIGGTNVRDMFAYRVTKGNWTGRPTWPPNMAMDTPHGTAENATLYMSWNGATDIDSWAIVCCELVIPFNPAASGAANAG